MVSERHREHTIRPRNPQKSVLIELINKNAHLRLSFYWGRSDLVQHLHRALNPHMVRSRVSQSEYRIQGSLPLTTLIQSHAVLPRLESQRSIELPHGISASLSLVTVARTMSSPWVEDANQYLFINPFRIKSHRVI